MLITVDVAVPHTRTLPVVDASQIAQPIIVEEPAVHAANVNAPEFVLDPDAAADISDAEIARRA